MGGTLWTCTSLLRSSCKDEGLEARSIAEDREQAMIDGSVEFDPGEGKLTARLPFIKDPARYLHNNRHVALKVLERNFRKLQRRPEERQEVIQSFRKLYGRVVNPLSRLPHPLAGG